MTRLRFELDRDPSGCVSNDVFATSLLMTRRNKEHPFVPSSCFVYRDWNLDPFEAVGSVAFTDQLVCPRLKLEGDVDLADAVVDLTDEHPGAVVDQLILRL